jgi:hypothetical protein
MQMDRLQRRGVKRGQGWEDSLGPGGLLSATMTASVGSHCAHYHPGTAASRSHVRCRKTTQREAAVRTRLAARAAPHLCARLPPGQVEGACWRGRRHQCQQLHLLCQVAHLWATKQPSGSKDKQQANAHKPCLHHDTQNHKTSRQGCQTRTAVAAGRRHTQPPSHSPRARQSAISHPPAECAGAPGVARPSASE